MTLNYENPEITVTITQEDTMKMFRKTAILLLLLSLPMSLLFAQGSGYTDSFKIMSFIVNQGAGDTRIDSKFSGCYYKVRNPGADLPRTVFDFITPTGGIFRIDLTARYAENSTTAVCDCEITWLGDVTTGVMKFSRITSLSGEQGVALTGVIGGISYAIMLQKQ